MHNAEHRKDISHLSHHPYQVNKHLLVLFKRTIKALVLHSIDPLTLVRLTLDVKEVIREALATYLVRKPDISRFLNDLVEFSYA